MGDRTQFGGLSGAAGDVTIDTRLETLRKRVAITTPDLLALHRAGETKPLTIYVTTQGPSFEMFDGVLALRHESLIGNGGQLNEGRDYVTGDVVWLQDEDIEVGIRVIAYEVTADHTTPRPFDETSYDNLQAVPELPAFFRFHTYNRSPTSSYNRHLGTFLGNSTQAMKVTNRSTRTRYMILPKVAERRFIGTEPEIVNDVMTFDPGAQWEFIVLNSSSATNSTMSIRRVQTIALAIQTITYSAAVPDGDDGLAIIWRVDDNGTEKLYSIDETDAAYLEEGLVHPADLAALKATTLYREVSPDDLPVSSADKDYVRDQNGDIIGHKYWLTDTDGTQQGLFTVFDDDTLNEDFALADGTTLRGRFN